MAVSTVIAISREFGSGGARIGREVARRLGLQYADREILSEAAKRLHVETSDVAPLEERVRGFWDSVASMFAQGAVDTPFMPPPLPLVSESELFAVEREIVQALAQRGGAVIVGRGAAHILRGRPGVRAVFLHAPLENRVMLAIEEYRLASYDEAATIVRASDAQRARFVKSLTGHEWCDATLYDLCLDTAAAGFGRATDLIVNLAQP